MNAPTIIVPESIFCLLVIVGVFCCVLAFAAGYFMGRRDQSSK
jgi:hypothetical protein